MFNTEKTTKKSYGIQKGHVSVCCHYTKKTNKERFIKGRPFIFHELITNKDNAIVSFVWTSLAENVDCIRDPIVKLFLNT